MDQKLKDLILEEKMIKTKSYNQSKITFNELKKLKLPTSDSKSNVERYLALLPPMVSAEDVSHDLNNKNNQNKTSSTRLSSYKEHVDKNLFNIFHQTALPLENSSDKAESIRSESCMCKSSK